MAKVGIHLRREAALPAARERGADCVQLFLGDPQGWKIEPPNDEVKALAASELVLYVHAPYGINLASGNNRVRIPSRKLLQDTCTGAAGIGAAGVIVHGGHVTAGDDLEEGFTRWSKALERLETSVPVLLENTAGGTHAMARRLEVLERLWERVAGFGLGFCLDTCHAHAGGEPLDGVVDRVRAITGRVDLVHANDSKDPAGSGRDRHENLGDGQIGREAIVEIARAAGAPVIFETPGDVERHREDIATLRAALSER